MHDNSHHNHCTVDDGLQERGLTPIPQRHEDLGGVEHDDVDSRELLEERHATAGGGHEGVVGLEQGLPGCLLSPRLLGRGLDVVELKLHILHAPKPP